MKVNCFFSFSDPFISWMIQWVAFLLNWYKFSAHDADKLLYTHFWSLSPLFHPLKFSVLIFHNAPGTMSAYSAFCHFMTFACNFCNRKGTLWPFKYKVWRSLHDLKKKRRKTKKITSFMNAIMCFLPFPRKLQSGCNIRCQFFWQSPIKKKSNCIIKMLV